MTFYPTLKKHLVTLLMAWAILMLPIFSRACDTSGFLMDGITDNGDGTFTIEWTAMVAGGNTTGVGSTYGFYLNLPGVQITNISPTSFTSANGTTLNAILSGSNIAWGNPVPGTGPVFLNIATEPNDQWFPFTITVQGIPTEWNGGGQEGNNCPGGAGSSPINYEGVFPCFEPEITPLFDEIHICPGETVTLSVIPNHLVETITWGQTGLNGETITTPPIFQTIVFEITAANVACETTASITVIVDPLPVLEPFEEQVMTCEGFPAVLTVIPQDVDFIVWNPGGPGGPTLLTTPTTSPTVYTATGSNICGDTTVEITVILLPPPTVQASADKTICNGQSATLQAIAANSDMITWQPGGSHNNSITVSPTTTTSYIVTATGDCGLDLDTVTVTVVAELQSQVQMQACVGETVNYNGIPLAAGSTSTFTFTSAGGCDSVVTVNVAALPNLTGQLQLQACAGESALFNGQMLSPGSTSQFTFTASNGCDSVLTVTVLALPVFATNIHLEACAGESATYNGQPLAAGTTATFDFQAANGCDSTVTVTVDELPTYASALTLETCTGTMVTYNGQALAPGTVTDFVLASVGGCDSVVTVTVEELSVFTSSLTFNACPGSAINYNGQALAPGTVTDFNFTTASGCDSVVTVTVNEVAAFEELLAFDACTGTTVSYNGQTLQPGTVTDFNFQTAQGCDSIVTVTVNELPVYSADLTLEACAGSTVDYNGQTLSPGTVTDFTLTTTNGCDSVVTVTVEEVDIFQTDLALSACAGETVSYNGQQLAPGSITDFTFTSSIGCDSIVTVTVAELPAYQTPLALKTCPGTTVAYNGLNLSPGTNLSFTFTAVNGCDSVVQVSVSAIQVFHTNLEFEACTGSGIDYNGQSLQPGSVTNFAFTSSLGCDSTVTVTVNELATYASALTLQACTGSTITYNGMALPPNTVMDFVLTAQNGCDSTVTVTVEEVAALTSNLALSACTGNTAFYNGQNLPPGSVTDFLFASSQGCDSIVTVTVEELQNQASIVQLTACTGTMALYNGQPLAPGSTTDFSFPTWQGCDSIVTVTVEELAIQTAAVQLQTCEGTGIDYNGQTLFPGSVTDFTLTAANGCDSIVTVSVAGLPGSTGTVTLQGCEGETLLFQGAPIQPGTSMDFVFTAANGCDSVVTVTALLPLATLNTSAYIEICEGGAASVFGQEVFAPGEYSQTFTSANGCDSTHTVTVAVVNKLVLDFTSDITIRLGDSVVLHPIVFPPDSLTYAWQPDPSLSCLACRNPVASPQSTTTYLLTIYDPGGCQASASQLVIVDKTKGVFIPNGFSPNGDGINDVFMIFSDHRSVKEVSSFLIFSRWGESVYEYYHFPPDDPLYGWDGFFKGKDLDAGVFTYLAEVEFIDGEKRLFKGDVTLVR
ncbi:MAG: gliding motility-associated C-terminal domain-containing protein [Saprospiraceae bacterium]|nr:gliding motility-associated C-terminal domain-containing protein [Saprospiraceae bacterium]